MPTVMNPDLWPMDARRNDDGEVEIAGHSLPSLAQQFGTPLYVFSEAEFRDNCRSIRDAFGRQWPRIRVVYAGKAGLSGALTRILMEEGLGLDVVSGGELAIAIAAGVDPADISFHGNNKGEAELREAVDAGVGKIVVDNFDEIERLAAIAAESAKDVSVLIRLNPGVDVHTHRKISTGIVDSKFGFPIVNGQAREAVRLLLRHPQLRLLGYHAHVGSQLFDADAYVTTINDGVAFAAGIRCEFGIDMQHFSPGGGFGIGYVEGQKPKSARFWAETISGALRNACGTHDMPEPVLTVEPGRSIIGPAGVSVYTVGSIKDIPGVRTYVAVDGGMADNIRPSLYDAEYAAVIANRDKACAAELPVAVVGKYCESGDVLVERVSLPDVAVGDVLALPGSGAYCLPLASNYNGALRPTVVLVSASGVEVIKRRETYEDLLRHDPVLESALKR